MIADGARSGDACKHWELFDDDFARAANDGHTMHRLSLEWSRIEPQRGRMDPVAIEHYHGVFASLRKHGLIPLVTLHHFTNPLWIAEHGGWENHDTVDRFCDFARFCAREYGAEVDWWCTVNEPEVLAFRGWSEGTWPPAKKNDRLALMVIAHQLEAHGRAYRILHEEDRIDADGDGREAVVGFAKNYVWFEPLTRWSPLDQVRAKVEDKVYNQSLVEACITGNIHLSIPGASTVSGHVPELENSLDFLGLNVYTRWMVRAVGAPAHVAKPGAPLNDLGWEVVPSVLGRAASWASQWKVPLLVTEHGFADAADRLRPKAMVESLLHLGRAIEQGANVIGYLHWSLLDNFEWADGYRGRFGLYQVDFEDPHRPRRRTRSAELLAGIAKENGILRGVALDLGITPP